MNDYLMQPYHVMQYDEYRLIKRTMMDDRICFVVQGRFTRCSQTVWTDLLNVNNEDTARTYYTSMKKKEVTKEEVIG